MRLPKRIEELIRRKDEFLTASETALNVRLRKMQGMLLSKITAEIIPQLDMSNGRIRSTLKNFRILSSLDKVYNDFQNGQRVAFVEEVGGTLSGINSRTINYFQVMMGLETPATFKAVAASVSKKMGLRLGLDGGSIVSGGFFDTLIKNEALLLEVKQMTAQAVTAQIPMKDYIKGLNTIINGDEGKIGGIERQFNRYAHDVYHQYASAYSTAMADETGMKYFIYQGGLVKDSRDFCVAHNNKVFKREDAEKWRTWTPSQGVYPEGYKVKQKNQDEVPSYLSYPGYDPLTDRGGYNCRHWISWLNTSIAERMLKAQKKPQ